MGVYRNPSGSDCKRGITNCKSFVILSPHSETVNYSTALRSRAGEARHNQIILSSLRLYLQGGIIFQGSGFQPSEAGLAVKVSLANAARKLYDIAALHCIADSCGKYNVERVTRSNSRLTKTLNRNRRLEQ